MTRADARRRTSRRRDVSDAGEFLRALVIVAALMTWVAVTISAVLPALLE